jgi:putative membrane protein
MKKLSFLLLVAGVAGFLPACKSNSNSAAVTDSTKITTVDSTKGVSSAAATIPDEDFAMKAGMGGMTEVAVGKLALTKTSNTGIKKFAQMMVDDHGKANDELKQITQKKNINLPATVDAEHQAKLDSLGKLTGASFDAAYVSLMVEGHEKTLTLMQDEANNGKDADLKAFATKIAPVVKMHLNAINKIHSSMK